MRGSSCARIVALLAVLGMLGLLARRARADTPSTTAEDPRKRAEALIELAALDEQTFAFARAVSRYDEGRALDPGGRYAQRAESRAATLRAHAEGDFAPLVELERVRRDPGLASDGRALDELVRHAETFPPGLVRVEVWVLAAEAYARRLGRPADADALLGRVIVDPSADPITTRTASRDRVTLRLTRGDLAGAEAAVRDAGPRADPELGRQVRRLARRRNVHHAAIALLLAMIGLAARAVAMAAREGRGPEIRAALRSSGRLVVGYALYVGLAGALLASRYEQGTTLPFLAFGAVLVPVVLVARGWGAAGGVGAMARVGRAALSGLVTLGSAFLVLEGVDATFLDGMGL